MTPDLKPLLPCPHCGSSNVRTDYVRDGRQAHCVDCRSSGAPAYHGPEGMPTAEQRAIAAWNRRAALSAPANGKPCGACEDAATHLQEERVAYSDDEWRVRNECAQSIRENCRHAPTPSLGEKSDISGFVRMWPETSTPSAEAVREACAKIVEDAHPYSGKRSIASDIRALDLSKINAVPDRFFIEHGVVHDRKTGRHLHFDDNILAECDALNAIERATAHLGGVREEYLCAISKTDAEGPGTASTHKEPSHD